MNDKLLQQIRSAQRRADEASRASAVAQDRVATAEADVAEALEEAAGLLGKPVDAGTVLKLLDAEIAKVEKKAADLCAEADDATNELNAILSAAGGPDGE